MKTRLPFALCALALLLAAFASNAASLNALLIDGHNNHDWKATTPVLKAILEEHGLFQVDLATAPRGASLNSFKPEFSKYQVIISNYNGPAWSPETREAFENYMRDGGGFVPVHAANNSFPDWKEYNLMIGLGGWGGRNEKSGPYLRFIEGRLVRDPRPGSGGSHGAQHAFPLDTRAPEHPIMAGLPSRWMHAKDELYDRLRGPAENVTVLATAHADPATGGSGHHEPLLMAITYGKGRIFHTALGHGLEAIQCLGFAVTLQRGAEWAATGQVTQKVPSNFPGPDQAVTWPQPPR